MPKIHFTIECSKGTYVRSIAYDFGAKLKSGGYLSKLNREKIEKSRSQDKKSFLDEQ